MDIPKNVVDEIREKNGILAIFYFDLYGKDAEKLKEMAVGFAANLNKAEGIYYVISQIAEPEEYEGYFSTYVESVVAFKDVRALFSFVMAYSPVSLNLIIPETFSFSNVELEEMLRDVSNYLFELKKRIDEVNPKRAEIVRRVAIMRTLMGKKLLEGRKDVDKKKE